MVVFLGKGSALWRGVVGLCPGCPGGGGRERGAGASQNTCHLPWVTRYLLPMLSLHDQSRGPWILLHVVCGPWTFFVAALDKGRFNMAVCRRYKLLEIRFICKFWSISLLPDTYSDPHSQNGFGKANSMQIRIHSTGF